MNQRQTKYTRRLFWTVKIWIYKIVLLWNGFFFLQKQIFGRTDAAKTMLTLPLRKLHLLQLYFAGSSPQERFKRQLDATRSSTTSSYTCMLHSRNPILGNWEQSVSEAQYFSSTVGFSILRSEHLLQNGSNVLFWNQFYGICPLTLLLQLAATSMKWNINLLLASLWRARFSWGTK